MAKFVKGVSGNPKGRPKGKTIKERILDWLEDHPEDMGAFVQYFVKNNRNLTWQMLEGRPKQNSDIELDVKDDRVDRSPEVMAKVLESEEWYKQRL